MTTADPTDQTDTRIAFDSRTLDLGCGPNKRDPDAVGVDIRDYGPVDYVTDIETGLPFPDDHFERVYAYSILEHLGDLPTVMADLHRVCEPGAVVEGKVPHWRDRNAYIDPTHQAYAQTPDGTVTPFTWADVVGEPAMLEARGRPVAGFDEKTFEFWDSTTTLGQRGYFDVEFRVRQARRIQRVQFWKSRPIRFELEVVA